MSAVWHIHHEGSLHFRHKHELPSPRLSSEALVPLETVLQNPAQQDSKVDDSHHQHEPLKEIGSYGDGVLFKGAQVLIRHQPGLRGFLFPRWTRPHPWWDILPVLGWSFRHSKYHYNSSGIGNALAGLLTLLTQGFKITIITICFALLNHDNSNQGEVFLLLLYAMLGVASILLLSWGFLWKDFANCVLSIFNWAFYILGWGLGAFTFFLRIYRPVALVIILGPPAYIFVRTLLFFPFRVRREAFLFASISNRSVPCGVNYCIVGPKETIPSHKFLCLLNLYAFFSTFVSKIVIFALRPHLAVYVVVIHAVHLILTLHSSLYQIRCRQIAIDAYIEAEEMIAVRLEQEKANLQSQNEPIVVLEESST